MNAAAPAFLLRVEGINLDPLFSDTQHISVIRGASMALREAVADSHDWLRQRHPGQVQAVSTGASVGLFRVEGGETAARDSRDFIAGQLNRHPLYRHLTFAVDVQPLADFGLDREKTLAKLRFRQLRQPSVAVPPPNSDPAVQPCPLDGLRPATEQAAIHAEPGLYSASVAQRYRHGRGRKKDFYERETRTPLPGHVAQLTWDLGEIADGPGYRQLNGKLAYVYVDGNQFGQVVDAAARQTGGGKLDLNRRWDAYIQDRRRQFLQAFIEDAAARPGFLTADRRLRLEILLWGGDEFLLVVPAWLGFHALDRFYQAAADWSFPEPGGQRLSHAGGLVFCHHKTPVHRASQLARQLAERVKEQTGRQTDAFEYAVLESIDYPTEALDRFFRRLYLSLADTRQPLQPRQAMAAGKLPRLPKSQVYALARAALRGPAAFDAQFKRLGQVVDAALLRPALAELASLFGADSGPWPWVHLAQLWDYLAPTPE